jgi:hypothetical protein
MTNMKVILSAVGAAALLVSPALAKTQRPAPSPAQAETRAPAPTTVVSPYGAGVSGRTTHGLNPDFQNSGDK